MKSGGGLLLILAFACLQSAGASDDPDTLWACRDTTPEIIYFQMFTSDTFPDNRGMFSMTDTGDAIDGNYINFNYQFGNPNPGYAGFKIFWDYGIGSFWVVPYDSLVFWYKGPLPGHKVMMIWAQGSAGCGTAPSAETIG